MPAEHDPYQDAEQEPLLRSTSPPKSRFSRARAKPVVLVLLCTIGFFMLQFGSYLATGPLTRIYESIVCRDYYSKHESTRFDIPEDIPEEMCKIRSVQSEVAFVQGLSATFDAIPSLVLSIPYGRLADNPKYGRKTVLLLSLAGVLLDSYWGTMVVRFPSVFPLRAVWAGSIFTIIGGGLGVTNAMLSTTLSDVIDAENRATVFFQIMMALVVGEFLAPPLGSWMMMKKGPWLPYLLGISCATLGLVLLLLIPETIHMRKLDTTPEDSDTAPAPPPASEDSAHLDARDGETSSKHRPIILQIKHLIKSARQNLPIIMLMCSFFTAALGRKQIDILLLYVSTRYSIPISSANFALSVYAGVSIFLLVVVLPALSRYLTGPRRRHSSSVKDLSISRVSVVFLTLGCFAIGIAPTIATMTGGLMLYTLGGGFNAVNLSLVSAFAEPRYIGRLYSLSAVFGVAGTCVGGPFLAGLFSVGLGMGEKWTGLPFLGTGLLYALVCVGVWSMRLPASVRRES